MARPRTENMTVSLFPFLSVLACVVATLTLMLAGMATGQVNLQAKEEDPTLKLRQLVAQAVFVQSLLEIRSDSSDPLARQGQLEEELRALQQQTAELEEVLKDAVLPELPVAQLRPSGSGITVSATFVDCTQYGVVLLPEMTKLGEVPVVEDLSPFQLELEKIVRIQRQVTRVRLDNVPTSQHLRQFLERAKKRPAGSVVFLIRPDGVPAFKAAEKIAREMKCEYGYLPVPEYGPIDFSGIHGTSP